MIMRDKKIWNGEIISHPFMVSSIEPSFLQSWQWGELQEKLGKRVFRFNVSGLLASPIEQKLSFGQTYFYVPHGPVIRAETQDAWTNFLKAFESPDDFKRPVFLRIEPLNREFHGKPIENVLSEAGFRLTKPVQPNVTLVIDLRKNEKEILGAIEHDARYSIRAAEKRGGTVEFLSGKDKARGFDIFWRIFMETNLRHELKTYPKIYYEEVATLEGECSSKIAIARTGGEAISAAIFIYFGERTFYLFAGSRAGYGRFNLPTYFVWPS